MMIHLLPCPFCGGEALFGEIHEDGSPEDGGHFIQCVDALCAASSALIFNCGDDPHPLLALRWNRRARVALDAALSVFTPVIEERDRLRGEVRELLAVNVRKQYPPPGHTGSRSYDEHLWDIRNAALEEVEHIARTRSAELAHLASDADGLGSTTLGSQFHEQSREAGVIAGIISSLKSAPPTPEDAK